MAKSKFNIKDLKKLPAKVKQFWKEPPKGRFLNLKEILCLSGTGLGISFIYNIITMYVTVGQLPLLYNMGNYGTLHATVMYLIASVGGLILTPVYGKSVQRTNTRFGRYKPYILFLAPLVALFGTLSVWSPQSLDTTQTTIYVYCICTPTLLVSNIWYNTWNLFPGVVTPNQQERVDIWSPLVLIMGFAPSVMNMLKDVFAGIWGDIIAARIFSLTSAIVGTLFVICLVKVKERVFVSETESVENKIGIFQGLKLVLKNKPLIILTIALTLGCTRTCVDTVWHIIARAKFAGNMADGAKIFGAVSILVSFAMTPNIILMPLFTRKMNNRTIMLMWMSLNVGAYLILAIIGFQNIPTGTTAAILITALRFIASFNAINSLLPLMISEIADYQQYLTKYRLDGFIQTMAYSVPMVASQLFALVPAVIQGKIGFNPNNYIITEGVNGIPSNQMPENVLSEELVSIVEKYANIAIWISVVSGLLMLVTLIFYNLNKKKAAEISEQLKLQSVNAAQIEKEEGNLTINEDDAEESRDRNLSEIDDNEQNNDIDSEYNGQKDSED